ncbi:MAG: SCP2 sterol-binding domain-containing protein [Thermoplasmata archaeon]
MSDIKQRFEAMIERFNKKAERDEKFRKEIEKIDRVFQIVVTDENTYHCRLCNAHIERLEDGEADKPQIVITSDSATYIGIMDGEKDPLAEFSKQKLKVKASLGDLLLARKFIG